MNKIETNPMSNPAETEETNVEQPKDTATEAVESTAVAENEVLQTAAEKLEDPAVVEAARGAAAEGLKKEMNETQRNNLADTIKGFQAAAEVAKEGGEIGWRELIKKTVEEQLGVTIEEALAGMKYSTLETVLNPPGAAVAGLEVMALSKVLDVEPANLDTGKLVEVKLKIGSKGLKVLSLITKFVPEFSVLSVPADIMGKVAGRMGDAMETINNKPDASNYELSKEMVLAMLPRDAKGAIDGDAVREIISQVGGKVIEAGSDDDYMKAVGELLRDEPEKLTNALGLLDKAISAK